MIGITRIYLIVQVNKHAYRLLDLLSREIRVVSLTTIFADVTISNSRPPVRSNVIICSRRFASGSTTSVTFTDPLLVPTL